MVVRMGRRLLVWMGRRRRLHVAMLRLRLLRRRRRSGVVLLRMRRGVRLLLLLLLLLLLHVIVLVVGEAAWMLRHQPESGHGGRRRQRRPTAGQREKGWGCQGYTAIALWTCSRAELEGQHSSERSESGAVQARCSWQCASVVCCSAY